MTGSPKTHIPIQALAAEAELARYRNASPAKRHLALEYGRAFFFALGAFTVIGSIADPSRGVWETALGIAAAGGFFAQGELISRLLDSKRLRDRASNTDNLSVTASSFKSDPSFPSSATRKDDSRTSGARR